MNQKLLRASVDYFDRCEAPPLLQQVSSKRKIKKMCQTEGTNLLANLINFLFLDTLTFPLRIEFFYCDSIRPDRFRGVRDL